MKPLSLLLVAMMAIPAGLFASATTDNLLLNGEFGFSSFSASRGSRRSVPSSGSVPYWDQAAYGDAEVVRAPANDVFRPAFPVDGVVRLQPGKSLRQLVLLSEAGLDPGDTVSLSVHGHQKTGGALHAAIVARQTDSEEGEWSPKDFGQSDTRTFAKVARGELIPVPMAQAPSAGAAGEFLLTLEGIKVPGIFPDSPEADGPGRRPLTVGVEVVFTNTSQEELWIYAPTLVRGGKAAPRAVAGRPLSDAYRHLPRTISKLRRGEPLHVIVMGSSIDRASANPPQYRYDEDPASPTFKQPLSKADRLFSGEEIGQPELTPYFGWWQHYWSYGGRLKQSLMRRFDYRPDQLLFNFMAADGSSIGESHSALAEWSELTHPPDPGRNGHQEGQSWQELYPELFARPEGPRPDLVIFGSGANEKIDGMEEVAAFEGAIRWFQRHYPGVEFVFAMWNRNEAYSRNASMIKELALRYGIPRMDVDRGLHLTARHIGTTFNTPKDGHPQAAAHALWSRELERAFMPVDPIIAGIPQACLPERLSPFTIGWEGETRTYEGDSPRIYQKRAFIADETVVNLWAITGPNAAPEAGAPSNANIVQDDSAPSEPRSKAASKAKSLPKLVSIRIDGLPSTDKKWESGSRLKPMNGRDPRNSTFAIGKLPLGERHIIEVAGEGEQIVAVDAKTALHRVWYPVESKNWQGKPAEPTPFVSEWGAPYGSQRLTLPPGRKVTLEWIGTAASVAWLHQPEGGTLVATVDGREALRRKTDETFALEGGQPLYMEDRGGILHLPFGVHRLEIEAQERPVALLGAWSYDTRPNRAAERIEYGMATPGQQVSFSAPYAATPLVMANGGLEVAEVSPTGVTFGGNGAGSYQVIGE
ncbi:MAG TPA: hypothetical protein VNQ90_10345 [Chthoniobacteraceae bacterium]|nr:hypothetical protein [Chthoniobacteraceae bacterium]